MIYRDFQNEKLSMLGFGMMRLPQIDGRINEQELSEMFDYAIQNGVNYFDTAWGYHNGESELMSGKYLSRYPRESYFLATKFPGYDTSNFGKVEEIFEKQLEKCRTEYFDFYLLHNIYERNVGLYLDDATYHTVSYLLEQKAMGRIRHLGFSCHGEMDVLKQFLAAYADKMEFCQLQVNYVDWHFQHADAKVELLNSLNIPVWVMEPVRGGMLASLPERAASALTAMRPEETVTEWSFRFLQSVPGVSVILSGMSSLEQTKENVKTFEEDRPLTKAEFDALTEIADKLVSDGTLPCTSCRYCTSYCPKGLDIPLLISLYNEHTFSGGGFRAPMSIGTMPEEKRPMACIGCKKCESVCPQQLGISDVMKSLAKIEVF